MPVIVSAIDRGFIRGYVWAVLERELHIEPKDIAVKGKRIIIHGDFSPSEMQKIRTALSDIEWIGEIKFSSATMGTSEHPPGHREHLISGLRRAIFSPLIADPFWPHFSVSYQSFIDDRLLGKAVTATLGENIPIYTGYYEPAGRWQVYIFAASFTINNLDTASWDLTDADYRFGIGISQRKDRLSNTFRFYHMSSHAGDEYILHEDTDRVDISFEAVNVLTSYDFNPWFRLYGGGTYRFSTIPDNLKPWSVQYGAEFTSPWSYMDVIRFVCGIDVKNKQETDWDSEVSIRAGIRIEETVALWQKIDLMIGYYTGPSPYGQFYRKSHRYLEIGTHIYF